MEKKIIAHISKVIQLNHSETAKFVSLARIRTIPKRKTLIKAGQVADKAYFLLDGILRHYAQSSTEQFTKNIHQGPRFVLPSLTSFFLDTPSIHYCESLTELKVLEWTREDVLDFSDQFPKMYKFLLKAVVKAFHSKEKKEIAFITQSAQERYHHFLVAFPGLINKIPVQCVASYLGIRPETLSRIRAKQFS